MRHLIALSVAVLLVGGQASAQSSVPRYDPEAHCNEVAEFGSSRSETTYVGCLRLEQLKERHS